MNGDIPVRVVWMDDTVKTYNNVLGAIAMDHGRVLRISLSENGKARVVSIPLANVRWWGTPGESVGW
jgi:hypothetical protein